MAISTLYVPLFNIEDVILDKATGLPLASGVVRFYRDAQRGTFKDVYQITGTYPNYTFTSMGNTLTLGVSGTFVDTNGNPFVPYAYPYDSEGNLDLYYVTVESSGGVSQFVRQAVPYVDVGTAPQAITNYENELCNPQFVEVLFNGSTTLSLTGSNTVTPIAPGWDLVTSGTGTVTLERLEPTAANVDTNPPYALSIAASSGLGASIQLRQRLNNTPGLMRNGYISATFTAAVISGGASSISMTYAPSTGSATTLIASTAIPTSGDYTVVADHAAIEAQVCDPASTGYIDIYLTIPTSRTIAITSVQVAGVNYAVDVPFDEQTADRQKDNLFHYYKDSILEQPKANLLTGWAFGVNPWQFRTTASSNVANNTYTADQTILIQQEYVASATGNNVAVGRAGVADNYAYEVTAVTATNQFAILQYIDPATIRPYWGQNVSVMVRARIATSHSSSIRIKARLIYRTSIPSTVSQTEPVATWTSGADPAFAAGWTALTPLNDPAYTLTGSLTNFSFDRFTLVASSNANMTLGLLIYTIDDMDESATADRILIDKGSLVPNDVAIEASPETFNQSLEKCQYYYQKSFLTGTLPATNVGTGTSEWIAPQVSNAGVANSPAINVKFQTIMRDTPSVTIFNPSAGNDQVRDIITGVDCSATAKLNITTKGFYTTVTTGVGSAIGNILAAHWSADARLGL